MCLILLENLMDSYKKILIDSFEDFLVDQARQFQNTPNFRIDSFRFFWTYIHPWFGDMIASFTSYEIYFDLFKNFYMEVF